MIEQKITTVSENLAVFFNSITGQYAIKTLQPIAKDSVIQEFKAKEYLSKPSYLSVQVSDHQHIHLEPEFLQYTNHSCEPTVFFDTETGQIIALRDINVGEEISFFYPATEWAMAQAFSCHCNTASCLGTIQGANYLSAETLKKYRFSEHIKQLLAR